MPAEPSHPNDGLFSLVDAMFVINLPTRADRRREFDAQLLRIGLGLDHPKVILFPAIRPTELAGFPTIGTRGSWSAPATWACAQSSSARTTSTSPPTSLRACPR